MKVSIDSKRCHGHARCLVYAPETFEADGEGYGHVRKGFEKVKPELEASVRKARLNCPENAISLVDD